MPLVGLEKALGKHLWTRARSGRRARDVQGPSREQGPGRAIMRSQRWAALHLGPQAYSTVVSSYGQLGASLVTPHLALPSERHRDMEKGRWRLLKGRESLPQAPTWTPAPSPLCH